jgi:hypothetical protein
LKKGEAMINAQLYERKKEQKRNVQRKNDTEFSIYPLVHLFAVIYYNSNFFQRRLRTFLILLESKSYALWSQKISVGACESVHKSQKISVGACESVHKSQKISVGAYESVHGLQKISIGAYESVHGLQKISVGAYESVHGLQKISIGTCESVHGLQKISIGTCESVHKLLKSPLTTKDIIHGLERALLAVKSCGLYAFQYLTGKKNIFGSRLCFETEYISTILGIETKLNNKNNN